MKISFDDGSSIDLIQVDDRFHIILSAIDGENHLKKIVNTAILTKEQLDSLLNLDRNK